MMKTLFFPVSQKNIQNCIKIALPASMIVTTFPQNETFKQERSKNSLHINGQKIRIDMIHHNAITYLVIN